jgi:ATP-dependent DNA helicase RecG
MTATPIPRTFALALFGDLHVSLLDEKPRDRKEIITQIIHPNRQNEIYEFIKKEISAGRQAYIILSLVEETDALQNVKAAKEEFIRLSQDIFPHLHIGLMHGRLKAKEKEKLMADFKNNKINILVSTSVIEVGVDVPNATIMIIENAERFGLSQLHQFRGRIGRGEYQSHCFLFSTHFNSQRLRAMEKFTDGFKLAEIDLSLRGPGEFLGSQQSGLPDGAMRNISNIKLVTLTRKYAKELLKKDPFLTDHTHLSARVTSLYERTHFE